MTYENDPHVMAEALGTTTVSYLGKDNVRALTSQVEPNGIQAIVWVSLKDDSIASQLKAIRDFSEVRDLYADELEISLRFGAPTDSSAELATVKTLVAA